MKPYNQSLANRTQQNQNLTNQGQYGYNQTFRQNNGNFRTNNQNQYNRLNKGKRTVANICGTPASMMTLRDDGDLPTQNYHQENIDDESVSLTNQQHGQLVSILRFFNTRGEGESSTSQSTGVVNFVGACSAFVLSVDFALLLCKCFQSSADIWILDSRSSNHMTFNRSHIFQIKPLVYPLLITLYNGYSVKVIEIGSVHLESYIVLHKVLYVPSFKYNPISVHCLTAQLKGLISFTNDLCLLQAPSMKKPLGVGKIQDGLYLLCPKCLQKSCCSTLVSNKTSLSSLSKSCNADDIQCISHSIINNALPTGSSCTGLNVSLMDNNANLLWHNRLCHVTFFKMREISTIPVSFAPKQPFLCTIYPMARQPRLPFPKKTSMSTKIFYLLHIDI